MAWIHVEAGVRDHPKIRKLARDCGVDYATGLGTVVMLWTWTIEHAADGNLSRYDPDDIECAAGWTGEPGKWYASAVARRLIDANEEGEKIVHIHDWDEHTTSYREAARHRQWRAKKAKYQRENAESTGQQRDSNVTVTASERESERESETSEKSERASERDRACARGTSPAACAPDFAIRFVDSLRVFIVPKSKSDETTLTHISQWVEGKIIEGAKQDTLCKAVLNLADKSHRNGQNPIAMLLSLLQSELGYPGK